MNPSCLLTPCRWQGGGEGGVSEHRGLGVKVSTWENAEYGLRCGQGVRGVHRSRGVLGGYRVGGGDREVVHGICSQLAFTELTLNSWGGGGVTVEIVGVPWIMTCTTQ